MGTSSDYPARNSMILLKRIHGGDPEALGDIARLYREPLRASLRRELGLSDADTEQAVKETLQRFVQDPAKLQKFVPSADGRKFRSFLFAFASNIGRNLRKKKKAVPVPSDFDASTPALLLEEEIRRIQARKTLALLMEIAKQDVPEKKTRREAALAVILYYECGRRNDDVIRRLGVDAARGKYLLEAGRKLARESSRNFVMEDSLSQEDFETMYRIFQDGLDDLLESLSRVRGTA